MSLLFNLGDHSTKKKNREAMPRDLFGFKEGNHTAHTSRTMMFQEISRLFDLLPDTAGFSDYIRAVVDDNALEKSTVKNRKLTTQHLKEEYGLSLGKAKKRETLGLKDPHDSHVRTIVE